jgi:hypothetical protein
MLLTAYDYGCGYVSYHRGWRVTRKDGVYEAIRVVNRGERYSWVTSHTLAGIRRAIREAK